MKILAVGSPKGGVGKSTITVNLAHIFSLAGLHVLVIDADDNGSSFDWIDNSSGTIDVDYDQVDRPRTLRQLAAITGYDLLIVDLPGSARKGGELRALLTGDDGQPVPNFVLVPTEPDEMDLRVVTKVITDMTHLPHRVVFTKVNPRALRSAVKVREMYRTAGWLIAETIIREYVVHKDSVALNRGISDVGGRHSMSRRAAEYDMRELAREVAGLLDLKVTIPQLSDVPSPIRHSSYADYIEEGE